MRCLRGAQPMRVVVMGSGGLGGYFGGLLARSGANVTFVARGAHLQALQEQGLTVRSVNGDFTVPVQACADPRALAPAGVIEQPTTDRLIEFGSLTGQEQEQVERVHTLCTAAGIPTLISPNIQRSLWE